MAGKGPPPSANRRRRNAPARGDWKPSPGVGWQHKPFPKPPTGLEKEALDTWSTWFKAWFAAHWMPEDLPVLRQIIKLYDLVERAGIKASTADRTELRQLMDNYGITKKGQQDRRWTPPKQDELPAAKPPGPRTRPTPYKHLRVVNA